MDLETENRIAAILLKEAAELRRQAQKEGVHAYLQQPKVRGRPNSRFLTATVLGVQQANRAVEVNEMWQARQKELEMDDRLKGSSVHDRDSGRIRDFGKSSKSPSKKRKIDDNHASTSYASNRTMLGNFCPEEDEGLRDEEVEEFLQLRVKRGRGAVGSRMDETGPYLPSHPNSDETTTTGPDAREHRVVFGPERPSFVKQHESSEEERDRKKAGSSKKQHSRKHKSKEKSKYKKKKDKRRKH